MAARPEDEPDVYFLDEYGRAASIADRGELLPIVSHGGAWRMPLIVRSLDDGSSDAITPAFSGLYASSALASSTIHEAWAATIADLKDRGLVSVVLRGSPFVAMPTDLPGLRSISAGRPTIVLDLTDADAAWTGMEGRSRNAIRKALKHGLEGELRPATPQDLAPDGDFRRLYEATMRRLGAEALYFFSDDYYSALLDGSGSGLLLAEVRLPSGEVVSSSLLLRYQDRLHYHLAGSSMDGAHLGSNNLMLWIATQAAIEQGIGEFHLGAGVEMRDSVFMFKRSFGGRELQYDVAGIVIDEESYEKHVRRQADQYDVSVEALLATNYFPAYRARPTE
jgi:hypothetical protein